MMLAGSAWQPTCCQARLSAARATPQLWPAAQYRPARYLCLCPLGPAIGPQPAAMPQRTAAARLLLLLASHVQLGRRQVGAQHDAIRATGDKFSLGSIEVEVLHGPTSHCRVQANVEDTGETARPSAHPHHHTTCVPAGLKRGVPGLPAVVVDYVGTFAASGKEFDSSTKHKAGFRFALGTGAVIGCWDEGLRGMCPGEKRRLHCPHEWAYGRLGSPPVIPPSTALDFVVELHRSATTSVTPLGPSAPEGQLFAPGTLRL